MKEIQRELGEKIRMKNQPYLIMLHRKNQHNFRLSHKKQEK